jgi:hypothetical protein
MSRRCRDPKLPAGGENENPASTVRIEGFNRISTAGFRRNDSASRQRSLTTLCLA